MSLDPKELDRSVQRFVNDAGFHRISVRVDSWHAILSELERLYAIEDRVKNPSFGITDWNYVLTGERTYYGSQSE